MLKVESTFVFDETQAHVRGLVWRLVSKIDVLLPTLTRSRSVPAILLTF